MAAASLIDRQDGDSAYILLCSILVLFMSLPGLALFYGGLVQKKNALSIFMQCFGITCVVSLLWLTCAYSLSFSGNDKFIGNFDSVFMSHIMEDRRMMQGDIPEVTFFAFQGTFAIITPALIIGAWAERAKFGAVLVFTTFWLLLVYCPVCHWVWGGGWLQQMGVRDFAGGIVVHLTAGAAALVAARMLPFRPGFPGNTAPPHSLAMTYVGACLLWVGWFGFNGGSALQANCSAAMASVTTQTSAVTGVLTWLAIEGYRTKPTVEAAVTGMIAGLGSITPASGFVGFPGALIIGFSAGVVTYAVTALIKERGIADDSLDVFSVHGVGGLVGTLLVAPLSAKALGGAGFDTTMGELFRVQCLGCLATFVWSATITFVLIKIIDGSIGFCHGWKAQLAGLDEIEYGGRAYELEEKVRELKPDLEEHSDETAGSSEDDTDLGSLGPQALG